MSAKSASSGTGARLFKPEGSKGQALVRGIDKGSRNRTLVPGQGVELLGWEIVGPRIDAQHNERVFMRLNNFLKYKALFLTLLVSAEATAFAPTNFFPPYDPNLRLANAPESAPFRIGVNGEWGKGRHARNWDGKKRNVLQVYEDDQSTLAMIEQPTPALLAMPDFIILRDTLRIFGARDDGIRGHVLMLGKFEQWDITPFARYVLPICMSGELAVSVALPIRHARVGDISFQDQTLSRGCQDDKTKELLTGSVALLKSVAKQFGNLNLDDWSKTGLGDLVFTLDWHNDYPQDRDGLENVDLNAFVGVSIPTGVEKDEDRAFSLAFGNDGAWSMPFGLGIDLDFKYYIALGASAQFEVIFDSTKTRRLKTDENQNEFLLLNKGRATRDHGLLWKFYLYLQGYHFWRGLSVKAAYEYVKRDDDRLTPKSDDFNASVANSVRSLDEWNMHHIIFQVNYDCFQDCKCFSIKPQLSFFYKLPIYGKGIINPETIGGQVAINF